MERHLEGREMGMAESVSDAREQDAGESYVADRLLESKEDRESCGMPGYTEVPPSLQMLDILQHSTRILRKHSNLLTSMAAALATPLSVIVLSHVLLKIPLMHWLAKQLEFAAELRIQNPSHKIFYGRMSEIILSNVIAMPISAIFSPLFKAGVAYIVACTYTGKKVSFGAILGMVRKVWERLMVTFCWSCSIFLAFAAAFISLLILCLGSGIAASSPAIAAGFVGAIIFGLALSLGFAYMDVVCNLAYVISVLEECYGGGALVKSMSIIKGKMQVALLLFLVTNVNGTLLDILFEYHILAKTSLSSENILSKMWEAPLLVFMHSFVYLFDAIMISVFYFLCKSTGPESIDMHIFVDRPHVYDSTHLTSL